MSRRNGDALDSGTFQAVARFPATAAQSVGGKVDVMAPHGGGDLPSLIVRPIPAFENKMEAYRERVARKDWFARWPHLTVIMAWKEARAGLTAPSS